MEQDHPAFLVDVKEDAGDAVLSQAGSYFVDAVTEWFADGHTDRPAELYRLDVFSNAFPILQ